jgi:hypothetical protein
MNTTPFNNIVALKQLSPHAQSMLDQARALADYMDLQDAPSLHAAANSHSARAQITCALRAMVIARRAELEAEREAAKPCASR